jgi:UDP-2,3-diacylglucosamine pyrophosphatase LpxH
MITEIDAPPVRTTIESTLQALFESAPRIPLSRRRPLLILSDLHLGDGGPRDDFRHNSELVLEVLRRYYLNAGYALVLNGDIEELQRFRLDAIRSRWKELYSLFDEFSCRTALYKIVGNHDEALHTAPRRPGENPLLEAIRLTFKGETLFIFHGHQATIFFERFNEFSAFFVRHFANALRIPNSPVTYESRKKYRIEHRVYSFSSRNKIVSIIGHTHRPLFESLSKIDTLRFRIEELCRKYPSAGNRKKRGIVTTINGYRQELARLWEEDREDGLRSSLYNEQICIPCLFNSGCATGKRGVTAIEISDGAIALVYWFDRTRGTRHLAEEESPAEPLEGSEYCRALLKQDKLEYIFSRIKLLT